MSRTVKERLEGKNNDVAKRTEVKGSENNEEKDGKNKKEERVEVFDNIVYLEVTVQKIDDNISR